ncbi:MAG: hypothetical protein K5912_00295 [Alphaproteobacteria bacterium]|nr:hypothetical protein [Alphaproteobacteria bacterium]
MSDTTDTALDKAMHDLDTQITALERERDELTQKLNTCESKQRKNKIAGITTLSTTGAGVIGNVVLYKNIQKQQNEGYAMASGRPAERKPTCEELTASWCEIPCKQDPNNLPKEYEDCKCNDFEATKQDYRKQLQKMGKEKCKTTYNNEREVCICP